MSGWRFRFADARNAADFIRPALVVAWVVVVLAFCLLAASGFGGLAAANVEAFIWSRDIAPASQPRNVVVGQSRWVYTTEPPAGTDKGDVPGLGTETAICLGSGAVRFVGGVLLVSFLWHWPRRRYLAGLLLPMIAAGFLIIVYCRDPDYENIRGWCVRCVLIQTAIQCGGIWLGVLLGRRIARTIVRVIIPAKPRQVLAFLWQVDGKQPPATQRW